MIRLKWIPVRAPIHYFQAFNWIFPEATLEIGISFQDPDLASPRGRAGTPLALRRAHAWLTSPFCARGLVHRHTSDTKVHARMTPTDTLPPTYRHTDTNTHRHTDTNRHTSIFAHTHTHTHTHTRQSTQKFKQRLTSSPGLVTSREPDTLSSPGPTGPLRVSPFSPLLARGRFCSLNRRAGAWPWPRGQAEAHRKQVRGSSLGPRRCPAPSPSERLSGQGPPWSGGHLGRREAGHQCRRCCGCTWARAGSHAPIRSPSSA